jgi:hypothetical protein
VVVETIIFPPLFLSAEPLAANTIAVTTQGDVDLSSFVVSLDGKVFSCVHYPIVSTHIFSLSK